MSRTFSFKFMDVQSDCSYIGSSACYVDVSSVFCSLSAHSGPPEAVLDRLYVDLFPSPHSRRSCATQASSATALGSTAAAVPALMPVGSFQDVVSDGSALCEYKFGNGIEDEVRVK